MFHDFNINAGYTLSFRAIFGAADVGLGHTVAAAFAEAAGGLGPAKDLFDALAATRGDIGLPDISGTRV